MNTESKGAAVVVGVGAQRGLGAALCRRFAREGLHVFAAGRTQEKLDRVVGDLVAAGGVATAVAMDTTCEADVLALFEQIDASGFALEVAVYNAGNNAWGPLLEMEASFFEGLWRLCCLGGFMVGREAARRMAPVNNGTLLFTGATAALRGRPPFTAFASAKAALRSLAQSMARELGPQGVHVAHIVIDGVINGDIIHTKMPQYAESKGPAGMLDVDAIAEEYWKLHTQHRSTWTQELDLRPFKEPF